MNAKVAKQIGAFPHKDLHIHTAPGTYVVNCSTGEAIHLPKGIGEWQEFCNDTPYGRNYYVTIPIGSPLYDKCKAAANITAQRATLEAELKTLDKISDGQCSELLKDIQVGVITTAVLFLHNENPTSDLTIQDFQKEIPLRKEDRLQALGKRYGKKGERTLWIALIEVSGLITSEVTSHYSYSDRFSMKNSKKIKHYQCKSRESTGYNLKDFNINYQL